MTNGTNAHTCAYGAGEKTACKHFYDLHAEGFQILRKKLFLKIQNRVKDAVLLTFKAGTFGFSRVFW